jgi:hypothetical protein
LVAISNTSKTNIGVSTKSGQLQHEQRPSAAAASMPFRMACLTNCSLHFACAQSVRDIASKSQSATVSLVDCPGGSVRLSRCFLVLRLLTSHTRPTTISI